MTILTREKNIQNSINLWFSFWHLALPKAKSQIAENTRLYLEKEGVYQKLTEMTVLAHISIRAVTHDLLILDGTFASVFTRVWFLAGVHQLTVVQGYLAERAGYSSGLYWGIIDYYGSHASHQTWKWGSER